MLHKDRLEKELLIAIKEGGKHAHIYKKILLFTLDPCGATSLDLTSDILLSGSRVFTLWKISGLLYRTDWVTTSDVDYLFSML